jgi:deoxyribodipyrimidine photo-lyase
MTIAILCLRRDLRLADNPALNAALAGSDRLLPCYLPDAADADPPPGAASRWWLHHSLQALDRDLRRLGSRLLLPQGDPLTALRALCAHTGAGAVYWNRRYEPAALAADRALKAGLQAAGIPVRSFNAALLNEPWEVLKEDGAPYRVFTPYWRNCLRRPPPPAPLPAPKVLPPLPEGLPAELSARAIEDLGLLPRIRWDAGLAAAWQPGEAGAQALLTGFLEAHLADYPQQRDRPDRPGTSRLSPHLHFGEVSPRQLHQALAALPAGPGAEAWLRQLYWREFAHALLFHFPHSVEHPLDPRFRRFPWATDPAALGAWQQGRTGIPIVDAGMRELWHTGWMHNRVRMLAASFLTKHLLLPWQAGAAWFWDTLVDADLANNGMGWQWVAGCGADAAPYFRIFNPISQGERFDPNGDYVRRWVPELRDIPGAQVHRPRPVAGYPPPLLDLAEGRRRALEAYESIKGRAPGLD